MKPSCVLATLLLIATVVSSLMATSILIQKPEDVIRSAPLIVEVKVERIDFRSISNISTGEALITLRVLDRIVGHISAANTRSEFRVAELRMDCGYDLRTAQSIPCGR